jgi:L,D-peptidoglycan transpeptidase YkuD (ErfK/YbiS/YcfS/YnhG family)
MKRATPVSIVRGGGRPGVSMRIAALVLVLLSWLPAAAAADDLAWRDARQLVLVLAADWDRSDAELSRWARVADRWQRVGAARPASIGRAGAAWGRGLHPSQPGAQKVEGDGRAPAGVFALGPAFGYAAALDTALDYLPMGPTHWCMDVADSPLYNRIVDTREVGEAAVQGSTERMRLDLATPRDQRYRLGLVIGHNPQRVAHGGSCIFAHLWKAPGVPTAGCTAMDGATMQELLEWLDPAQRPVFVLLPRAEHARLRQAWDLPAP